MPLMVFITQSKSALCITAPQYWHLAVAFRSSGAPQFGQFFAASSVRSKLLAPLVRIMEAPSAMRRRASPRSRAPQTKGTLNWVLSI